MTDEIASVLDKMIADLKGWIENCDRMLELLQPEWDKFQARTGHNTYVARCYADHTSNRRTHQKELDALLAVRAILENKHD